MRAEIIDGLGNVTNVVLAEEGWLNMYHPGRWRPEPSPEMPVYTNILEEQSAPLDPETAVDVLIKEVEIDTMVTADEVATVVASVTPESTVQEKETVLKWIARQLGL